MSPNAPVKWHDLINGALDNTLTPVQKEELAELLATTQEARQLWYLYHDNECSLGEMGYVSPSFLNQTSARGVSRPAAPSLFRSRTLQAAAAGLVVGLLCASVGWAVTGPAFLAVKSRPLPIENPGFESGAAPATEGVPRQFGVWSGDFSALSIGEQGVTPVEGKTMLRLLRSDNQNTPTGVETGAAEVWQAIDMTPFLKAERKAPTVVELSAQFNTVDASSDNRIVFGVSLEAFSGDVQQVPTLWQHRRESALVRSGREQPAGHKPGVWQTVSTQLSVPHDANILLVHLFAVRKSQGSLPKQPKGHFLDGVSLRLLETDSQPTLSKR